MRHGRVGQPGPRYVLIDTVRLHQSGYKMHQITFFVLQSRTRESQKFPIRKNSERVLPTNLSSGANLGVLRLLYKQQSER